MNMPLPSRRARQQGFTLIELMIAVAIIGILMRLAYPIYNQSVVKSRRSEAKTALLDLAQREERYMATTNQYTDSAPALGFAASATVTVAAPMTVSVGTASNYTLDVSVPASSPTTFTATARPTGTQKTKDLQCGNYTLDNTGKQGVFGTSSASDCW
jgi:type IV pilus assembly protein PilE